MQGTLQVCLHLFHSGFFKGEKHLQNGSQGLIGISFFCCQYNPEEETTKQFKAISIVPNTHVQG